MYASTLRCSNCGAPLRSYEKGAPIKCAFCGTLNAFAEPPAPEPTPFAPPAPRPPSTASAAIVFLVVGVLIVAGVGAAAFFVASGSSTTSGGPGVAAPQEAPLGAPSSQEWEGVHGAILHDVNGDGVPDLLGRARYVNGGDAVTLAAFDGATGKKIWESKSTGTYTQTYQGALGLAGDALLFALPTGELTAWSARDGQKKWTTSLPEKTSMFCSAKTAGQVVAKLADGTSAVLMVENGQPGAPAPPPGDRCARIPDDTKGGDPSFELREHVSFADVKVPGMNPSLMMQRPGGPQIVLGTRDKGTSVPMIAALYADAQRNWTSELPGTKPLEAGPFGPEAGAVTSDRAFAEYGFASGGATPHMVVAFDLSGHRLWESKLPDHMPISAINATDARVYVSQWGHVCAFDAATGKTLFTIGRVLGQ